MLTLIQRIGSLRLRPRRGCPSMRVDAGDLKLSPSDLVRYLACHHLTELDRKVAEGGLPAPSRYDPSLELLRERGMAHEKAYVESLQAKGLQVVDVQPGTGDRNMGFCAVKRSSAAGCVGAYPLTRAGNLRFWARKYAAAVRCGP